MIEARSVPVRGVNHVLYRYVQLVQLVYRHVKYTQTYPLLRRNRSQTTRPINRVIPYTSFVNELYKLGIVSMKSTGIIKKTCNFELILNGSGRVINAKYISIY